MKVFKLNGKIENSKIEYYENNMASYKKFKADNEGKHVDIIIEIMEKPEYFQHKYYRGGLLPAIAEASGEHNIFLSHVLLKFEYLYNEIGSIDEIPKKYMSSGIFFINEMDIESAENMVNIPCQYIQGVIIIHGSKGAISRIIKGYIPSTADLTYEEMKQYIKSCENRLFIDLKGELSEYWGKYKQL